MQKLYMYSGTWDKILGWHQANGIRIANSTYSGTILRYFNKSFFPCWWFEQFSLSHQDSNLDEQNQNLSCCHYTMGQFVVALEPYHHSYLRLAFSFDFSGTERLRWGATSFDFYLWRARRDSNPQPRTVTGWHSTNWTTRPDKINKRMEEWEKSIFCGSWTHDP